MTDDPAFTSVTDSGITMRPERRPVQSVDLHRASKGMALGIRGNVGAKTVAGMIGTARHGTGSRAQRLRWQ